MRNAEERVQELMPQVLDHATAANAMEVTERNMGEVGDVIKSLKQMFDVIDAERRENYTDPLNKVLKNINAGFKRLTEPLTTARAALVKRRDAVLLAIKQREQKEAEERAQALAAELESNGGTEAAEAVLNAATTIAPRTAVRGIGSVTSGRFKPGFKVVDMSKVPERFLLVDESLVKSEMRTHYRRTGQVLKLPGFETWEEVTGTTR